MHRHANWAEISDLILHRKYTGILESPSDIFHRFFLGLLCSVSQDLPSRSYYSITVSTTGLCAPFAENAVSSDGIIHQHYAAILSWWLISQSSLWRWSCQGLDVSQRSARCPNTVCVTLWIPWSMWGVMLNWNDILNTTCSVLDVTLNGCFSKVHWVLLVKCCNFTWLLRSSSQPLWTLLRNINFSLHINESNAAGKKKLTEEQWTTLLYTGFSEKQKVFQCFIFPQKIFCF